MALREGSEKATSDRLQQVRESYINVLTSTVENSRWLVTLVLAEMAGIVTYRSNLKKETLGPWFAIVIIALGLSLAAFVVSVLCARFERRTFENLFGVVIADMSELVTTLTKDDKSAPVDNTQKLFEKRESAIESLPSALSTAGWFEIGGLVLLGVGSCLAALAMFLGEFLAMFGIK